MLVLGIETSCDETAVAVVEDGRRVLSNLLSSQAHLHERLGQTADDAAGEGFDKVGRFMGLGFPGGPALDRLAREGNPAAIRFPRAMAESGNYDFSLSGLKTAVVRHVKAERARGREPD